MPRLPARVSTLVARRSCQDNGSAVRLDAMFRDHGRPACTIWAPLEVRPGGGREAHSEALAEVEDSGPHRSRRSRRFVEPRKNVIVGWQFHLYLIVEGQNDAKLQRAIKKAFPPEPTAVAAYDFKPITDPLEVITYAYKAEIKRRSGYVGGDGKHRTKPRPLKGADLRELLPFLARHKVGARLILSGVRRNGQRLVFTPRKGSPTPRS